MSAQLDLFADPQPQTMARAIPGRFFSPPDVEQAAQAWKCSCGPASVAALTGLTCAEVRPFFPGHKERGGWANPTHVMAALTGLGVRFSKQWVNGGGMLWPRFGLVFVQFGGPWMRPGVPVGQAYRRTHWVAYDATQEGVYDVNADRWIAREDWEQPVDGCAPAIAECIAGCDGTWFARLVFEVSA